MSSVVVSTLSISGERVYRHQSLHQRSSALYAPTPQCGTICSARLYIACHWTILANFFEHREHYRVP